MGIEITAVQIRPFTGGPEKPVAFASVVFNHAFIIKDLKIIKKGDARFVAMPSRRGADGVFRDTAHPLDKGMRDYLEGTVLEAYDEQEKQGFPFAQKL